MPVFAVSSHPGKTKQYISMYQCSVKMLKCYTLNSVELLRMSSSLFQISFAQYLLCAFSKLQICQNIDPLSPHSNWVGLTNGFSCSLPLAKTSSVYQCPKYMSPLYEKEWEMLS